MNRRLIAPIATSIISLFVAIGLQFMLPAVMLARWGNGGYAMIVAIQGFALYVSVSDFGVQAFVTRQLAVALARGDSCLAATIAVTAFKTLVLLGCTGCLLIGGAFVALGTQLREVVAPRAGVGGTALSMAFVAQIVSTAFGVVFSGWSTSVESAAGRYQRVQVVGLGRGCLSVLSLIAVATIGGSPTAALMAQSATTIVFDFLRFSFSQRLLPLSAFRTPADSPLRFLSAARGSVLLAVGVATQNGLQPAVIAVLSENAAAAALPSRTLANGARTVAMAVSNVLWVPLAAKLARDAQPSDSFAMWRLASRALSTLVLAGIAVLLTLAPFVVPLWLPRQSAAILAVLPFFAAEQAAFMAAFPSLMLLQAVGRFGRIGAVTLITASCSVLLTYFLVPRSGAGGFGVAGALATSCVYAPGLVFSEYLYWRRSGVAAKGMLLRRSSLCLAALLGCLVYRMHPAASALLLIALTLISVAGLRPWHWLASPRAQRS